MNLRLRPKKNLQFVNSMDRRLEKLHGILFEILGTVVQFPNVTIIFLSHIYSLNNMEKKEVSL